MKKKKFAFTGSELTGFIRHDLKKRIKTDYDPEEHQRIGTASLTEDEYLRAFTVAEETGGFIVPYRKKLREVV